VVRDEGQIVLLRHRQAPYISRSIKEKMMSWDEAYIQLKQELGREPHSSEVQTKMLEIAKQKIQNECGIELPCFFTAPVLARR
jgi:DNA-directed RNA polymerase specialized sigma subunit